MTFQAYLDTVKKKTGKTPDDFKKLAKEKGLTKHGDLLAWLKSDFGLGHGHANAIIHAITRVDEPEVSTDDAVAKHFGGAKSKWRVPFDSLMEKLNAFGSDAATAPTKAYISLVRGGKKFGIVAITADRMDIGIKLKGTPAAGRLAESGAWNAMVTHRVQIDDAKQIDAEVINWLKQAYDQA